MQTCDATVLILGIGNVLWADEGFGVRVVEHLNQNFYFPEQITLMDGGTQGLYLVPHIQQADVLIVLDAIDYGLAPGELKIIEDEQVPKFMGAKKMSLHQTGFQEVLSMAQLLGDYPEKLILIGVQPQELDDFGGSLRPKVKAQIPIAVNSVLSYLTTLGFSITERNTLEASDCLSSTSLHISHYETERPSSQSACRTGDERILHSKSYQFDPKSFIHSEDAMSVDVDKRRAK